MTCLRIPECLWHHDDKRRLVRGIVASLTAIVLDCKLGGVAVQNQKNVQGVVHPHRTAYWCATQTYNRISHSRVPSLNGTHVRRRTQRMRVLFDVVALRRRRSSGSMFPQTCLSVCRVSAATDASRYVRAQAFETRAPRVPTSSNQLPLTRWKMQHACCITVYYTKTTTVVCKLDGCFGIFTLFTMFVIFMRYSAVVNFPIYSEYGILWKYMTCILSVNQWRNDSDTL